MQLKLLSLIPFAEYFLGKFVPILQQNRKAQNYRDAYIYKLIDRSKEELKNGGNAKDMISLMLREKDENRKPIFPKNEILAQGEGFTKK